MVKADFSLGPHERWLYGPGQHYDMPGLRLDRSPCLSCLAEFPNPVQRPHAAVGSLLQHLGATMEPRFPPLWTGGGFQPRFLPLFLQPQGAAPISAHDPDRLEPMLARLAEAGARHLRLNFPIRSETVNRATQDSPPMGAGVEGPVVVLGIIDHGIAFAHAGLRGRMDYCWSQSALAAEGQPVPFGQEFTRDRIARLRAGQDEDEIYRAAGLLGGANRPPMPLAGKVAHGTHVLGTALADAPEAVRVVAVDLPATALWDTSGFGTDMFLLAGLHYIFERADRIAKAHGLEAVPVVVNISLGWSGGPHDGTSALEAALEEMIRHRRTMAPTALVLPTGNMYQDALSARIEDRHFAEGTAALRWFAPPCDMTSSFAEVWLPGAPDGWQIELAAPDGSATVLQAAGPRDVRVGGRIVGLAMLDRPRGGAWRATFCLAPTEPKAAPPGGHAAAPAGEWWIRLRRPAGASGVVTVRVQRDVDHQQGRTGARQSRLRDPDYATHDATGAVAQADGPGMLCRMDGLSGLATQAVSLNVGAHVESLGRATTYSSAGVAGGRGVDVSAPGDRGIATPGVLSWTSRSGGMRAMSGTSSAAPAVAGALCRALLADPGAPATGNYLPLLAAVSEPVTGAGPFGPDRLGTRRLRTAKVC